MVIFRTIVFSAGGGKKWLTAFITQPGKMKFYFLLFQFVLATNTLYEKIHKYDDQYDKMKRAYDKNISKFKKEQRIGDPTILLIWWGPQYPLLKRIEKECGGCWITHEKHLEKEAAGFG